MSLSSHLYIPSSSLGWRRLIVIGPRDEELSWNLLSGCSVSASGFNHLATKSCLKNIPQLLCLSLAGGWAGAVSAGAVSAGAVSGRRGVRTFFGPPPPAPDPRP